MAINTLKYIEQYLKIKTKDNKILPLVLNEPQQRYYEAVKAQALAGKPIRVIILKARQMGFSTLTEAMIFKRTATSPNVSSLIIAHKDDSTNNLFEMSKLFFEHLPEQLRPMKKASNAKELVFDNPAQDVRDKNARPGLKSRIKCTTAGGDGVGRSDTFTNVHASEFAFWPGDKRATLAGILQAVPNTPNSMVVIESTANGYEEFKELWDAACDGKNDYVPLFFAWYEHPDYKMPYDGSPLTAEEEKLKSIYNLSNEQIAWRRWCIATNCLGDIDTFKQEYPSNPEEAFLMTGRPVFNTENITTRIAELKNQSYTVGSFFYEYQDGYDEGDVFKKIDNTTISFREDKKGCVKIYKEPTKSRPYVIGGDTSGDGSDNFTGQVLDNITGEQVAVLLQNTDEDMYAEQMYCLGYYYNIALLGIETNFSTFPVKRLQQLCYPKQYMREVEDSITHKITQRFGVNTNAKTRPLMIAELVSIFRNDINSINDIDTLKEALTFVKNDSGRPEAASGKHDDLLMGLGIAHYIRPQQRFAEIAEKPVVKKKLIERLKPKKAVRV